MGLKANALGRKYLAIQFRFVFIAGENKKNQVNDKNRVC